VEEAEKNAKNFTIVRDLVQSAADTGKDYEKIPTGRLFSMKRELVAEIAEYYGIKDEGQRRSVLVDQIKAEREAQAQIQGRMDENES
jgi:hypothetical protein